MQTKAAVLSAAVLLLVTVPVYSEPPKPGSPPTDPNFQYTPEDFGVGRKHVPNAWCNQQIDKLLDEVRICFNTKPAAECDALQKNNSRKVGGYVKSLRCSK